MSVCSAHRHTLRDRRSCTTACAACQMNGNSVWRGKKFLYRADKSSQGRIKICCTGLTSPTNQTRKDPLQLYSISPQLPRFEQSAGVIPLYGLSGFNTQQGHPSLVSLVSSVSRGHPSIVSLVWTVSRGHPSLVSLVSSVSRGHPSLVSLVWTVSRGHPSLVSLV
jgi:hypothetical protein